MQIALRVLLIIEILFFVGFLFILLIHKYREMTDEVKRGIWIKYGGYFLVVNLFLLFTFLGSPYFHGVILILIFLGLREFFQMMAAKEIKAYRIMGFCVGLGIYGSALFKNISLFYSVTSIGLILILIIPLFQQNVKSSIINISCTLLGVFYASFLLTHILLIYQWREGISYVVFLYTLLVINDGFAELFGRLFGKRKIWPKISPNKTYAGSIGGFLSTVFSSILFHFVLPHLSIFSCMVSGAIIAVSGQIGDLIASVFKRDSGLKDFGNILPSHGGIIDRFDGLIFTAPIFYYYLSFTH